MDHRNAVKLLDDTFNHEFNLNRFSNFIGELFNHFNFFKNPNDPKVLQPKILERRKEYKYFARKIERLGNFRDTNNDTIEVFIVQLKNNISRDRARTMQRNLIANYLENYGKAALVAFYGDDPSDWRFSFVKLAYDLVKDDNGLKAVPNLTPARRYSFLVGKNEPNYTCKSQFLELIKEESIDPVLSQIENAFNIEKVTKDFFEAYKGLYLDLKESLDKQIEKYDDIWEDFENKHISSPNFAKKLMGQIVFIYFLQKKGWLGVQKGNDWGTGPKDFLRRLYNHEFKPYENFFNDILEPLFYEALANEHKDDYHPSFNCRLPFLNGGLFEPINDYDWENTTIKLKNKIFEEILDTFDRYNFTVKEDEPLEKEIAVDPEMLGKVFENLLEIEDRKSKGAYYTPREIVHYMCQKSLINYLLTNSDYPKEDIENFIRFADFFLDDLIREIIDFGRIRDDRDYGIPKTIRQNPFEIHELLLKIKIVDPAVGSGAFPVGMMNEIVKARSVLSLFSGKKISNYEIKLQTIQNSLYGVDIDSSAVDVTKLRFWLSLIVDENDANNIHPLPNLEHKIRCGNSLLEEFEGIKLFDENILGISKGQSPEILELELKRKSLEEELDDIRGDRNKFTRAEEIDAEITKISKKRKRISSSSKNSYVQSGLFETKSQQKLRKFIDLRNKFYNEKDHTLKDKLRDKIDSIEWELIEETLIESDNEDSMEKLEKYRKDRSKPFFLWKLYFSEVFQRNNPGFDIVIMNPPYLGEDDHKDIFRPIARGNLSEYYQGKMDIFYFFFHLALNIGRSNSQISFITTNYYPTATGAIKLRKDFTRRAIIRNLINFNELKIFESAKGQHNMITILTKGNDDNFIAENCETKRTGLATPEILNSILNGNDELTDYYNVPQNNLYDGENDYIRLMGTKNEESQLHNILNKIISESDDFLGNVCEVNQGVISGCDTLTKRLISKMNDKSKVQLKDGIFVFNLKNKRDLKFVKKLNAKEKNLLKPFFKNSEVSRYWCNKKPNKLLLYINNNINDLNDYPNIEKHLFKFKDILGDRLIRYNENYPWFHLHRSREQDIFEKQKITVPYRSDINSFAYNDVPWYCRTDCYVITQKTLEIDLKYILAILNSRLFYLWLYFKGKRKGQKLELFQTPLSEIPIKKIPLNEQKPFILLVNQILDITEDISYLKDSDKILQIKNIEKSIDMMIFDLYNISSNEQEFIYEFNKEFLTTINSK